MTDNYLTLLEESLRNKLKVLAEIQEYNLRQQEIFRSGNVDISRFDEYVAEKDALIEKVIALDNGFEMLYENVATTLKNNREQYADQIRVLQVLVKEVTDTSVAVQAQEVRTKGLIEDFFRKERKGMRQGRRLSQVAYGYYKNMSGSNIANARFMDDRK